VRNRWEEEVDVYQSHLEESALYVTERVVLIPLGRGEWYAGLDDRGIARW
jgi:hypothetical protein